ncbi:MAG: DNA-3-methyladenine glycosylase [Candidatus Acidiferrales bacterium]
MKWARHSDGIRYFPRYNISCMSAPTLRSLAPLRRSLLPLDAVALARFLIGKTLVRHIRDAGRSHFLLARVVETEAYLPGDAAAHSFIGVTPRNRSLFLRRGHAYVYFCYGAHFMLNCSADRPGTGAGVLFRAAEPLAGMELMSRHRRRYRGGDGGAATIGLTNIARGPGRLAQALRIDRSLDGADFCARGPIWLARALRPAGEIGVSVRIGITKDAHRPLRFFERGSEFVSGPRRLSV